MATEMDVLSAISQLGFESLGNYFFGTWNGYAITLRKLSSRTFFVDAAVRLDKATAALRRTLAKAVKEKGVRIGGTEGYTKSRISFSVSFGGKDEALPRLRERLDAITAALRENGVTPANTCAVTGAARPDSLCLIQDRGVLSFQPVNAAAIREREAQTREKAEENQTNGSYATGIVGAALGMLVGLIPNLLTIVFTQTIYSLLFALVPICAVFGYKLFRGKMDTGSIIIVVVLSLIAVPLMLWLELAIYIIQGYGLSLGAALSEAATLITDPDVLGELGGELVKRFLFMGLGLWVAWSIMRNQTNRSAVQNSAAQMSTLRPNPACQQAGDFDPRY